MRRVIVPALLAIAMVASSSVNASAFGLFDKLCNKGCDTCCDVEPACGCEAPCAPTCGCEAPCAPSCGCEADPCCDSGCGRPKMGLLKRLFAKHHNCCDSCCEPACGCEVIAPACGCEAPCAPTCGCEAPCAPSCGCEANPCCGSHGGKMHGLFAKLFRKHNKCCDSCCDVEPTCGCEAPCEPTCGCEPSCGCGR